MQKIPCPFCGSSEQEIYDLWYDGSHILVFCECGAQAGEAENEKEANALNAQASLTPSGTPEHLSIPK